MDMLLEAILAEQPFYPKQTTETPRQIMNEPGMPAKVKCIENTDKSLFQNQNRHPTPVRDQQVASIQPTKPKPTKLKDPERHNKPSPIIGAQFMPAQFAKQVAAPVSGQNTQANEFNQNLMPTSSPNLMSLGKFESDKSQMVRINIQ